MNHQFPFYLIISTIYISFSHSIFRLLADAKYLHQKLSVLRNVGAPTGMLETVVTEKPIPRAPGSSPSPAISGTGNANASPAPVPGMPPLIRSNTLNANQRLKGLLSGRSATFAQSQSSSNVDKALPPPQRTESPPPVPPSMDKPRVAVARSQSSLNVASAASSIFGASNASVDRLTNDSSQVSLGMTASPPIIEAAGSGGFKQVEAPPSPNPDAEPAASGGQ